MPPSPKLLDLRPDRSLLNSDFPGYKLSLREISTLTTELGSPVDRLFPNSSQYSLLHAKLFGLHNHLTGETYEDTEAVYFFDTNWNLQEFKADGDLVSVWELPMLKSREPGDYNVSIKLISRVTALVADGVGTLYILQRGLKWIIEFSDEIAGPNQNFIIIDGTLKSETEMHILLLNIRHKEESERFCSILHWMTLTKNDDGWNQVALRELTVPGFVQFANFEESCTALYVISDAGCKFTLDSENIISVSPPPERENKYTWSQSNDELKIKIPSKNDLLKDSIQITSEHKKILVKFGDEVQMEGDLYQTVDSDMTTWSFEPDAVEIVLSKSRKGLMWPELILGDHSGEYVVDPIVAEEIAERLAPLTSEHEEAPATGATFNTQQVEECDFALDKLTIFERIDKDSHKITHRINMGSQHVLLTVKVSNEPKLSFGVRFDVDACVWQPKIDDENFRLEHKGTLMAMGYIQASKQQMKYFVCSPDLSYSAICEGTHIFIYCQQKPINQLRHRSTGRILNTLAQQLVYRLPSNIEVMGLYASNNYLYILGENFITVLKI